VAYTQTVPTNGFAGGNDVALEAVPEASTFVMLAGAALTGLGYAGLRRIRRRKDDDESAEADATSEKVEG
jgi:MYXO-CTERM domain-containing protein